jgi:hypothetical protein
MTGILNPVGHEERETLEGEKINDVAYKPYEEKR